MNQKLKGVLLVNLGTPDRPDRSAVYKYLKQFLLDKRVIDYPWLLRNFLVRVIIIPFRSGASAKLYKRLWTEQGSPLKFYGLQLSEAVQNKLGSDYVVELAMRYQNPSIASALNILKSKNVSEITVLPLFPQYASASTGSVLEEVMRLLQKDKTIPNLRLINSYPDQKEMIEIFAENARKFQIEDYDRFIFSFHGLPQRQLKNSNPNNYCLTETNCCNSLCEKNQFCYSAQCHLTAKKIAECLNLNPDKCTISFQSSLGPEKWTQPNTIDVINNSLEKNEKKLLVFSPAFVADCLETTVEIAHEYKEEFIRKGGIQLDLVPSLNNHPKWSDALANMITTS